jgi:hypothetical protein
MQDLAVDHIRFSGLVVQLLEFAFAELDDRIAQHFLFFIDEAQHKFHGGSLLLDTVPYQWRYLQTPNIALWVAAIPD